MTHATPHAGGSVEVEEDSGAGTSSVLEDEVAVEEDGFDLGEEAVVAVEVRPARLHHADFRFGKVVDDLHQPVARGHKIGVEDGYEFALSGFKTFVEGSGLETVAIGAVKMDDRVAEGPVALADGSGDIFSFVG